MDDRPDLAALTAPLLRALLADERPILERHGVSMWAYIVLNRLADEPVRGQSVLADAIGADKTRIIDTLDDLLDLEHPERARYAEQLTRINTRIEHRR